MLFLVKLQVLHNTTSEVFFTLLNETSCPKSQEEILFVKRKLYALCISSIATPERKIHGVKYARIRVFSNPYFVVYGNYFPITRMLLATSGNFLLRWRRQIKRNIWFI